MMTQKQVMSEIRARGLTVSKTADGQFRINYRGGSERTAYYCDDASDAYATAVAMASGTKNENEIAQPNLDEQDYEAVLAAAEKRVKDELAKYGLTATERQIELAVETLLEGGPDEGWQNGTLTMFVNMLASDDE